MFVLQKAQLADGQELTACALGEPGAYANVGGLRLEIVPLEQRIAQYDLTLTMGEVGEAFIASFDYNVQLFDAATVGRWARHFERLLEGIVEQPAAPVSALPLITPEEERQLTAVWNDNRHRVPARGHPRRAARRAGGADPRRDGSPLRRRAAHLRRARPAGQPAGAAAARPGRRPRDAGRRLPRTVASPDGGADRRAQGGRRLSAGRSRNGRADG